MNSGKCKEEALVTKPNPVAVAVAVAISTGGFNQPIRRFINTLRS